MSRILAGLPLLLVALAALADVAPPEPAAESNVLGTVVFAVLFFGACVGFVYFIWKNEKKKQK